MFCVQCGKQIPDDSHLCCYCGGAVNRTAAAPEVQPPAPEAVRQAPAPVTPEKKPTPKKLWLLLGGIAAVVVLAVLAVTLLGGGDKVDLWVLEEAYVDFDGEQLLGQYCTYDAQGNMVEFGDRMTRVLVGGAFNTETYTYNENGDCIQYVNGHEVFNESGLNLAPGMMEYRYTYENGKKTEKYRVDEDGDVLEEVYRYNGDLLAQIISYDSEGKETARKTFDENGRLVMVSNDNLQEKYSYDNKGRLLEIQQYERYDLDDEYELFQSVALHYDARGCLTEAVFDNGINESTIEYKTDSHGNITETFVGGIKTTYEYKKIRVSREQALKLVGEYYDSLFYVYRNRNQMLLYYRVEE